MKEGNTVDHQSLPLSDAPVHKPVVCFALRRWSYLRTLVSFATPITALCIYKGHTLYSSCIHTTQHSATPLRLLILFWTHGQLSRANDCLSILWRVGHAFLIVDLVYNCSVPAPQSSCSICHLCRIRSARPTNSSDKKTHWLLALVVYEYFLTLPLEISEIWSSPFTAAKLLYIVNRYGIVTYFCLICVNDALQTQNILVWSFHLMRYDSDNSSRRESSPWSTTFCSSSYSCKILFYAQYIAGEVADIGVIGQQAYMI